jgi:putative acetyltransferase
MSITIERVVEATSEVHDLIGELNDVLGAAYEAHQRHGLSIAQLFEPNVLFFVARLDGLAMGCGGVAIFDDYAEANAHVHATSGTRSGNCESSAVQDLGRGPSGRQVGLAPRNRRLPTGGDQSL